MANSVDPDQTAAIGAVCSGSTLFVSILNSSVMLGNYLQQTTSADDIFRCIFTWRFKGQGLKPFCFTYKGKTCFLVCGFFWGGDAKLSSIINAYKIHCMYHYYIYRLA